MLLTRKDQISSSISSQSPGSKPLVLIIGFVIGGKCGLLVLLDLIYDLMPHLAWHYGFHSVGDLVDLKPDGVEVISKIRFGRSERASLARMSTNTVCTNPG
jgi:hypothetical protein